MRSKLLKRLTLADLECCDGVYNVSQLVDVDGSQWVSREAAEEIVDMANSHVDWIREELEETKETNKPK
jgi:hypothetical protein